jgi:hypothetical protein
VLDRMNRNLTQPQPGAGAHTPTSSTVGAPRPGAALLLEAEMPKTELTEADWNVYERVEAMDHCDDCQPRRRKARFSPETLKLQAELRETFRHDAAVRRAQGGAL